MQANADARLAALRTSLWAVALVAVAALFFTGLIPVRPPGQPRPEAAATTPAEAGTSQPGQATRR